WIMTDPEQAAGEPAANQSNNNVVLPLTVLQPLQTCAISALYSPSARGGTVSGAGTYVAGALVPLVATPSGGCQFLNWTKKGSVVTPTATYPSTAATDGTFVANFALGPWKATPSAGANGTITPNGVQSVADGGGVNFSATPNAAYKVDKWSV